MAARPSRIIHWLPGCLCAITALAQQNDVPLDRDIYYDIDRNGAKRGSTMHTGLRPIIESRADLHNVMGHRADSSRHYYWITQKLFKEHLVQVREGGFRLTADPIFRFEVGKDFLEGSDFSERRQMDQNSRGFRIAADLGPTVSFQTMFMENQATPPGYLYNFAQTAGVMPGQGRIKAFNTRGLDFAWATGNVSWSPRPWLNAQLGQGRHSVGNGYRSMLLSDNASPYPYVKFSVLTNNRRFQYTAIYAKLEELGSANRLPTGAAGESLFWWKRATWLHVSTRLGPLQLALFEGTLWKTIGPGGVRAFDALQLNPLIGLNTAVNGFDGRHAQLLGLDAKLRITDQLIAYGQYALTDPGRSRYAWQTGVQWFNLLRRDLHLLAEYNQATPFAYTNADARMNWTHAGQPLASPIGPGSSELVVRTDYGIRQRYWFQGEISLVQYASGHGPGWEPQRLYAGANASWRINQMSNMQLTLGYQMRDLQPAPAGQGSGYLFLSYHTGLFNRYYDL